MENGFMNATQFADLLQTTPACEKAREWAKNKSLAEAWSTCPRADWLLWLVGRMADQPGWPTRKQVVLAACDCAETALPYVPNGEERPSRAIETARRWVSGKATIQEAKAAAEAADDYAYATDAGSAAVHAAYTPYAAAAHAFAAAWYAAEVAAVFASEAAAGHDVYVKIRSKELAKLADLVRKRIPVPYQE